jgi:hypothetical protein
MTPFIYPPQPAEAPRHLAPIRPPPTSLGEEEDTKALGLPLELSKRPVPDGDLDVSVDLGEAVARTPALTPRAISRPSSSMPLDYLSLARGAPVVGARQPGEWKTRHFPQFMLHVLIVMFHSFPFSNVCVLTAAAKIAPTISEPPLGPSSRQAVTVKNRSGPAAPPKPHTTTEGPKEKKRKRVKKMKLDEIDEIFS